MSEEKNDTNFLNGHAELLSSIKKKDDTPESVKEPAPVTEETPVTAAEEASITPEAEITEEPATEQEPVEAEDVQEPADEPLPVEAAEPKEEEVTEQHLIAEVPPVVEEVPVRKPKPKKKPATPVEAKKQKHDALEQAEVKEVLVFINKYVKPAAYAVVAICIVFLGLSLAKNNKAKKFSEADNLLTSAKSAADYQYVLDNFNNTPSAPLAMLGLAQKTFNAGDIAGAESLYGEFLKTYAKHEMALQAELTRINCIEAQERFTEAADQYKAFQEAHAKSHLAPVALMGAARCKESAGDLAGARQAYEDVSTFYEGSSWEQEAIGRLNIINAKSK